MNEIKEAAGHKLKAKQLSEKQHLRVEEAVGNIDNNLSEYAEKSEEQLFYDTPKLEMPKRKKKQSADEIVADLSDDVFQRDKKNNIITDDVLQSDETDEDEEIKKNKELREALGI